MSRRALLAAIALLAMTACNGGNYPVDAFPEMHYQQSQRRLEPNRLAPARGAVPVTGAAPRINWDQARDLTDPAATTPERLRRGLVLYQANCAMCHGADGHAKTLTAAQIAASGNIPPVDFGSPRVRGRTDGQLYWIVGNGLGGMPPFGDLLSEDDRWLVVHALRQLGGAP